ncbi:hypothetical protein N9515_04845 [Vicingaceae bacterium]|nr:hypothetical protein [Vicingaceae bacterium]
MRRRVRNNYLFLILAFSASCVNYNEIAVDAGVIIKHCAIQQWQAGEYAGDFNSVNFIHTGDTVNRNIEIDSKEVLAYLKRQMKHFDTLHTNKQSILYIKSLFLADFVYAAFSYQFLGKDLGLANDSLIRNKWDRYSLEQQFDFGNQNEIAFSCGMRTKFYLKLTHQLLEIEGRDTSIQNVHTYPILNINGTEYLIDPSEPAVFINSRTNIITRYNQLKSSSDVAIYKLNYSFGPSHFIFSNKLLKSIQPLSESLNKSISNHLKRNKKLFIDKVPLCFNPSYRKQWEISHLNSENNRLIVPLYGRNVGLFVTPQNYKETYFGANCNELN